MTIEEIKLLVNQKIVENYTGDITAEDVNRIMNETLDHLAESERKLKDFTIDAITGILTYGGKHFQLIAIEDRDNTMALLGSAICGLAVLGTN